jgi:hypothetical protein
VVRAALRIAIVAIAANTAIASSPSTSSIGRDSASACTLRCAGGCAAIA